MAQLEECHIPTLNLVGSSLTRDRNVLFLIIENISIIKKHSTLREARTLNLKGRNLMRF